MGSGEARVKMWIIPLPEGIQYYWSVVLIGNYSYNMIRNITNSINWEVGMKRKKILLVALVAFLALPVFEALYGANVVHAAYDPTGSITPAPSGSGQGVNPSSSPVQTETEPAEVSRVPRVPAASPVTHTHDFQYVTVQEASETQDAVVELQCACGEVAERFTAPGSAAGAFIKQVVKEITDAPKDAVVTVDTKICTCYNQAVVDALLQRPDVTLVTNYRYKNVDYSVTIPAGYDVSTLLDENGYCGFRHLDQIMGE